MKKTFDTGRPWSNQLRRRRSRSEVVEVSNPKLVLATTFKRKDDGHLTASQKDLSSAKPIQRTNCIVDDLLTPMQRPRSRRLSCSMENLKLIRANDDKTEGVHLSLEANDNAGIDSPVVVCHGSIHSLLRGKTKGKRKKKELLHKLTYTDVDVNQRKENEMTPLHIAAEVGDEACAKVLIAFGADINAKNGNTKTPLDLAIEEPVRKLLQELEENDIKRKFILHISKRNLRSSILIEESYQQHNDCKNLNEYQVCKELERNLNKRPTLGSWDEYMAVSMQEKEIRKFKETEFDLKSSSRMLFLDGGGMKGLAQIEILCQIEEKTGMKITELFDWIVGTSIGAIIALGLVYGKKSLSEMRQLFYELNQTFTDTSRTKVSKVFEEYLQKNLGAKTLMSDESHPKVLITAVNKQSPELKLRFFNNCFDKEEIEVWKVARYSSAHPLLLGECDNYVDGGVLANNPCDYGMTEIQSYFRSHGMKLPIALVVSVGTRIHPTKKECGSVDVHKFFSFGIHWFRPDKLYKQLSNLLQLFAKAIVESEIVAENCRSRCEEQNIPFYRFSPHLDDEIQDMTVEVDKLLNMVIQTKIQAKEQGMDELIDMFRIISENKSGV